MKDTDQLGWTANPNAVLHTASSGGKNQTAQKLRNLNPHVPITNE